MKITVVLTCFNRKEKTLECVERLVNGNKTIDFRFVIVDDGSTDGTEEALKSCEYVSLLDVLKTEGNCYYSGGMHRGMKHILNKAEKADYLLMVNDDVKFYDGSIEQLVQQSAKKDNAVIVGATCDDGGQQTYGAVLYHGGFSVRYRAVMKEENVPCDTFNANCVLIPYSLFEKAGAMDENYVHSLGDFDYGLSLKRNKAKIYSSENFVGVCNRNSVKGTWMDRSLPLKQRLKLKESAKGAPAKQWFYFLKKNFGISKAFVFTITPYINLVLGR